MSDNEIFVATESAALYVGGERYLIHKGKTRVRSGHPLLKNNSRFFGPLDVDFDVEDATARPGQRRSGRRTAKKQSDSDKDKG